MEIVTVIPEKKFSEISLFITSRKNRLNKKRREDEIISLKSSKLSPFSDESDELIEAVFEINEDAMKKDKNPQRFQKIINTLPKTN